MSDSYTPITQALRVRLSVTTLGLATHMFNGLMAECDNIDAIHRSLEAENKEMSDFCDRLKAASEYREDVTLYGVDYIPVPLDKDGVPIHVGDTLEWSDGTTFEVIGIGDGTLYYLDSDKDGHISIEWTSTELKRHYRPDTWESIIADAMRAGRAEVTVDVMPLIKRCKALAGEEE